MNALLVVAVTLFSLAVYPGYRVMDADQRLYMAAFTAQDLPHNFADDILFPYVQFEHTYFDEMVRGAARLLGDNLFASFFGLTILARLIYYWAIMCIAYEFTNDRLFSWLAAVIAIGGMSVYGSGIRTLDTELVPRLLGMALGLLFFALWLNRRALFATLALSAATVLHPITALPWVLFFEVVACREFWEAKREKLFWLALMFVPLLSLFSLDPLSTHGGDFVQLDRVWEDIFRDRISYAFLTEWAARDQRWTHVVVSIILFFISLYELRDVWQRDRQIRMHYILLFAIPIVLAAISFIGLDILKLHAVAQWQLLRSLVLWRIFITLIFSYFIYRQVQGGRASFVYVVSLIGMLYSFVWHEYVVFLFVPVFLYEYIRQRLFLGRFESPVFSYGIPAALIIGVLIALKFLATDIGTTPVVHNVWVSLPIVLALAAAWQWRQLYGWAIALVAVVGALASMLFMPHFSIYPSYINDPATRELCIWVKKNTSPTAVFLTQPFSNEDDWFRPACQRSVFTTRKDGGQVLFREREFAMEWYRRIRYVQSVDTDSRRLETEVPPARFDYVVSNNSLPITLPIAFRNVGYIVYERR